MKRHGFTLIEVLIVIAIIGILSAVVLIGLSPFRASARDSRRIQDIKNLQPAIELYYARNGSYPATLQILKPNFISNLPTDPSDPFKLPSYCNGGGLSRTSYKLGYRLEAENAQAFTNQIKAVIPNCDVGTDISCSGGGGDSGPDYDSSWQDYCIWSSQ